MLKPAGTFRSVLSTLSGCYWDVLDRSRVAIGNPVKIELENSELQQDVTVSIPMPMRLAPLREAGASVGARVGGRWAPNSRLTRKSAPQSVALLSPTKKGSASGSGKKATVLYCASLLSAAIARVYSTASAAIPVLVFKVSHLVAFDLKRRKVCWFKVVDYVRSCATASYYPLCRI